MLPKSRFKLIYSDDFEIAEKMVAAGGGIITTKEVLKCVIELTKHEKNLVEFYEEESGFEKVLTEDELKLLWTK